jgi:hypothetical protein
MSRKEKTRNIGKTLKKATDVALGFIRAANHAVFALGNPIIVSNIGLSRNLDSLDGFSGLHVVCIDGFLGLPFVQILEPVPKYPQWSRR